MRGRTLVHVQGQVAYGRSHHVVRVVEEFDGLGVQREVVLGVVEEKLVGGKSNGRVVGMSGDAHAGEKSEAACVVDPYLERIVVELERQTLEEGDVVCEHLLQKTNSRHDQFLWSTTARDHL